MKANYTFANSKMLYLFSLHSKRPVLLCSNGCDAGRLAVCLFDLALPTMSMQQIFTSGNIQTCSGSFLWNKLQAPVCLQRCGGETVWREPRWPGGSNCHQRLTAQLWVRLHRDGERGLLRRTLMIRRQRSRETKKKYMQAHKQNGWTCVLSATPCLLAPQLASGERTTLKTGTNNSFLLFFCTEALSFKYWAEDQKHFDACL